jgi:hypothetical protein
VLIWIAVALFDRFTFTLYNGGTLIKSWIDPDRVEWGTRTYTCASFCKKVESRGLGTAASRLGE